MLVLVCVPISNKRQGTSAISFAVLNLRSYGLRSGWPFVTRLAEEQPDVVFCQIDVGASPANTALAMEKVLTKAESVRRDAHPVLRGGAKFPCFTLHTAPGLHPTRLVTGLDACTGNARLSCSSS
jgi:hypothetical protein